MSDQFLLSIFNIKNDNTIILFEKKDCDKMANPFFVDKFDIKTNNKINNNSFKSNKIKILILL